MIIEIGHEKGGVGKSMIAVNLAAYLADQKHSVVLVDTDTTMTSSKWGELRTLFDLEHHFTIVDKTVDPTEHILKLSENYDAVVVDVGARDYPRLRDMAKIVDLWIAPTKVGQADVESTVALADAFETANSNHKWGKIPMVVTVNASPSTWNSSEGAGAVETLRKELPNTPILNSVIRDRRVWRDAHRLGKTIFEMPWREREKAEKEFTDMIGEALKVHAKILKEVKKNG